MEGIVNALLNHTNSKKNPPTHTLITGGKIYLPKDKINNFYRELSKHTFQDEMPQPIVERIKDIHPLLFDIDLKYNEKITERAFDESIIEELVSLLWSKVNEAFDVSDPLDQGQVWIMMKPNPYPCGLQDYESKDGIHIVFPNIIVKRDEYKLMMKDIQESQEVEDIFQGSDITPDNNAGTMVDSDFSSWLVYGAGKPGESPYRMTHVYQVNDENQMERLPDDQFEEYYSSNAENNYTIAKLMSVSYREEKEINAQIIPEYLESLESKGFKITSQKNNSETKTMSKSPPTINPYEMIEEDEDLKMEFRIEGAELDLVKELVRCLDVKRADTYSDWIDVGMLLHNINIDLIDTWKEFSQQSAKYKEQECEEKWASFSQPSGTKRLGYPSLRYWAKKDNPHEFVSCLQNSLRGVVEAAASEGPDADYLIAKVAHEYLKTDYLSIDANDEWRHFNGTTWEKDMKGTNLRLRICKEIYALFHRYYNIFQVEMDKANKEKEGWFEKMRDNCHIIKKKLYRGNYVKTIMEHLRYLFYKKDVMQLFDSKLHLLGFENGVYDLREKEFRLGQPEDYLTMSTKIRFPVEASDLPLKIDELESKVISKIPGYDILNDDLQDFLRKIIPLEEVRAYTIRFLSKCLSGENRDEGFYIWTGTGGNGKSKLIDLMAKCLGDYYCNLPVALLTQKRKASGAASPEMAMTLGKRLAVMQEPDVNETLNVGEMKEITGNDVIQARGLYKEPFEFVPQFKLVMMCNDLPSIPSNDDGTWRRMEAVKFISQFVKSQHVSHDDNKYLIDNKLKEKLPLWKTPMMILLLREWAEYDEHGVEVPDAVKQSTRDYRNKNDMVGRWIDSNCQPSPHEAVDEDGVNLRAPGDVDVLHGDFKQWLKSEDLNEKSMTKQNFKGELAKWQEKSKWGYRLTKDGLLNGTKSKPRFNLILKSQ